MSDPSRSESEPGGQPALPAAGVRAALNISLKQGDSGHRARSLRVVKVITGSLLTTYDFHMPEMIISLYIKCPFADSNPLFKSFKVCFKNQV